MTLEEAISKIAPIDRAAEEACWKHWDSLCHPLRGFGRLEEIVSQVGAIQGTDRPVSKKRAVLIMGADNGVVAEGISQSGPEVTKQVLENMGAKISSVCIMARMIPNLDVIPVNVGMVTDAEHPRVHNRAVLHGTGNIAHGPAMTREECIRAIEIGIDEVCALKEDGYDLIVTGEMGIANTTTSAACACAMFGASPEAMTGRGAGLSTEGLKRKIGVVAQALEVNKPDKSDAIDICAKVGGLDIAGMVGEFLGAAACRMPVLIDGVISGIAAALAVMICPTAKEYMMATHYTAEPSGKLTMDFLEMDPPLHTGMHLGEGTGAVAFMPMLDQGMNCYYEMPRFDQGGVETYEHLK